MHSCAEVKQNVEKVCECTGEEKKSSHTTLSALPEKQAISAQCITA